MAKILKRKEEIHVRNNFFFLNEHQSCVYCCLALLWAGSMFVYLKTCLVFVKHAIKTSRDNYQTFL